MLHLKIGNIKRRYFYLIGVSAFTSAVSIDLQSKAEDLPIETNPQPLSVSISVPVGELEAVGQISGFKVRGCTATLIDNNRVLTAAHCVCPEDWRTNGCATRASFIMRNVFPVDNPNTLADESKTRRDLAIDGNVSVHPEYEQRGWAREDLAVIQLDQPVGSVALNIALIPVELPYNTPIQGDTLTLVGFGQTGINCSDPSLGKRKLNLSVTESDFARILFVHQGMTACPGDSGGPILNGAGHVVGVASWSDFEAGSRYRPTSFSYNWLFGIPQPGSTLSQWVKVEQAGINSHSPGGSAWCPNGSFIDAIDLDADNRISAHDSPVIGQVRCSKLSGAESNGWAASEWFKVEQRGINSHAQRPAWCPNGGYITQIDLDGAPGSADDSPVIGQVRCASLGGYRSWGSSYWVEIGQIRSHNPGASWCENGGFITQIDLDQSEASAYDDPIVGRAKCSHPIP